MHEYRSIREVPAAAWDSLLAPDDLQATHRFIRTCEESGIENARYRHLMVFQQGALAAVASLCLMPVNLDLLSSGRVRRAIRWARGRYPGFLHVPVVFCGLPVSFGQSCLRLNPDADAAAALAAVHAAAEAFAEEEGARVVCFKEFTAAEVRGLRPLTELGYLQLASLPSCRLALPWASFEAYLADMRSGYRRQVVSTLRSRDRSGISIRVLDDFGAECQRIFRLYEQVMDRAQLQLERLNLTFFQRLGANLPGETGAVLIERGGELLAAAILLRSSGLVTFLLAGIDYARARESRAYVHLVTAVVAEAIRAGAGALEMGQTSYALKQRLGAEPIPRSLLFRYRTPVVNQVIRVAGGALFPRTALPARQVFRERPVGSRSASPSASLPG